MERYLLFDSGCSLCVKLAQDIEFEAKGWLTARSLREPAIQALLQSQPGLSQSWEPTLLEIDGDQIRTFTGIHMAIQLVYGVGIRRAWRIARLVQKKAPTISFDEGRRTFLKHAGVLALLAVLPVGRRLWPMETFQPINNLGLTPRTRAILARKENKLSLPEDAQISELTGDEAQNFVKQALRYNDSRRLRSALPDFSTDDENSRVLSASWTDEAGEKHQGFIAAIPLKDEAGTEAVLFFSLIDGNTHSGITVLIVENGIIVGADLYQITNNAVVVENKRVNYQGRQSTMGDGNQPLMGHNCTQDCLIWCLQQFGCSGYALTLCIAAILSCPFFIGSCIVAWACALYCGGAWSICWSDICCSDL